jgi:hypothetical protein
MIRKLIHPISAGIFAAFVTFIYGMTYEKAMAIEELEMESLREAIPSLHLLLTPILACLIASFGYYLLQNLGSKWVSFLFYFLLGLPDIFLSLSIFSLSGLLLSGFFKSLFASSSFMSILSSFVRFINSLFSSFNFFSDYFCTRFSISFGSIFV